MNPEYQNRFLGEEYPAHFIFFKWVLELIEEGGEELLEGEIVGEVLDIKPKQNLYFDQGTVIAKSKKKK